MSELLEYPPEPIKKGLFSSLSVRNFRLFIFGHFISMSGVWMQGVALSWLVWRLTRSGDWLGAVGFSSSILTFVLGLIGGAFADKMLRRNVILATQILFMILAAILSVLTITNIITPAIILFLSLVSGAIYAFDFPARQSFITDMVGKDKVENAVALSSSLVHAARVVGPAAAGFVVAFWGEGACFVINTVTFLALISAILLMDRSKLQFQPLHHLSMHKAIREGLKTAWQNPQLKIPLILLATISMFGMPYYILVPIFISNIYGMGAEQYGFMMAASAVGALLGALIMAKVSGSAKTKNTMGISSLGLALSIIAFSWMTKFSMGLVTMVFVGLFALINLASINAHLQRESPDHLRGRIMSLYTIMFFGLAPFGSLLAGFSAERIGAPITLTIGGIICAAAGIIFMGIMPSFTSQCCLRTPSSAGPRGSSE